MEAATALADLPDPLDDMTAFITSDEDARHMQHHDPMAVPLDLETATSPSHQTSGTATATAKERSYEQTSKMPITRSGEEQHDRKLLAAKHTQRSQDTHDRALQDREGHAIIQRPLQLLDLPMDVLKDIVKEVTHTNDLASLALTHSALHHLAIPHIYSRFDIVWPDSSAHAEPRSGVDALTYGLATLVMAEEIFGESPKQRQEQQRNRFSRNGAGWASPLAVRRRRGNHYAHFTKKFSLGNGPADWVQEYLITKESGKMLGTLVALALARMRALETFIWDMPTGILRDVWLALSSLGDRDDGVDCRLEKVWVRFHNNAAVDALGAAPLPTLNIVPLPPSLGQSAVPPGLSLAQLHAIALDRVEHPSFSILPPMKSLNVLEVDELAYLDEMSVLIGKSVARLRELRVGIAAHAVTRKWTKVWDGPSLQQIDPENPTISSLTIGEKRLGGVLGLLTGFVHDMRVPKLHLSKRHKHKRPQAPGPREAVGAEANMSHQDLAAAQQQDAILAESDPLASHVFSSARDASVYQSSAALPIPQPIKALRPAGATLCTSGSTHSTFALRPAAADRLSLGETDGDGVADKLIPAEASGAPDYLTDPPPALGNVLQLETLELERVPLSIPILKLAFDWHTLTSLTLLDCPNHEQLWKTLRRDFAPRPKTPTYPHGRRATPHHLAPPRGKGVRASLSSASSLAPLPTEWEYPLRLKKIHTDIVSPALISFLKDTLAPDSLEELFLQDVGRAAPTVPIAAIHQGPLRRHRNSLRRLLIDSAERPGDQVVDDDDPAGPRSNKWRAWMLPRPVLAFVCGGKMPALRELGMAINYRDWHFFLQNLPTMAQLRSLYIPHIADHPHESTRHAGGGGGSSASLGTVDPRELAEQFVDVVALRPEVELCYMGIGNKCFEILERRRGSTGGGRAGIHGEGEEMDEEEGMGGQVPVLLDSEHDEDDDGEQEELEDDGESEDDPDFQPTPEEEEEEEDEDPSLTEESSDDDDDRPDSVCSSEASDDRECGGVGRATRLRLREILFYDDKVAIFKARHGRL